MSSPSNPNLLVIAGMTAHRYVGGTHTGERMAIDPEADPVELRSNLEWVRQNGMPEEPPAPQYADTGEAAFARILRELGGPDVPTVAHIEALSDSELIALWNEYRESSDDIEVRGWDGLDVHAELNRRGLGSYCAV